MAIIGEKTLSDQSDLEPFPATIHVYKLNTREKMFFFVQNSKLTFEQMLLIQEEIARFYCF